jgi:hypothetical protein
MPNPVYGTSQIQYTNMLGMTGMHTNVGMSGTNSSIGMSGTNSSIGMSGTNSSIGMSGTNSSIGMSGTNNKNSLNTNRISCMYDTFNFNAINKDKERIYRLKYNDEIIEFSINVHDMLSHKNKKLHTLVKKIENILKTSTDISLLSICKSILKKDLYINHLINNRIVIKI